ncbi:MAG: methyltransferase domain-containing protein [Lentisphaeria bacterium]
MPNHAPDSAAVRLWERYAAVYDRLTEHYPLYNTLMDRLEALLHDGLPAGAAVLDAACGTGNLSVRLAPRYRVTALDRAGAMLDRAADKSGTLTPPGFRIVTADLDRPLPFATGAFDAVACIHALYAVGNPAATLAEFHRILKPGGRLLIANMTRAIPLRETAAEILRLQGLWRGLRTLRHLLAVGWWNARLARFQSAGTMHFWPAAEFNRLLADTGFTPLRQELTYTCNIDLVTLARRTP